MKKVLLFLLLGAGMAGLLSCTLSQAGQATVPTPGPTTIPLAPVLAPPPGEVVLQDDFSAPLGTVWALLDVEETPGQKAVWYTEDGILVQGGTNLGNSVEPAYLMVQGGADWTDYTVQVNIYVDTNDEVGLIFRTNPAGFYRFRLRSEAFQAPYTAGLDRYQEGRYEVLWHTSGIGFPIRRWFTLRLEVRGDTFTVSLDGRAVATVQDAAFPQGGIGFYAWAEGGVYFDNLVVTR
jgi:hypothetical protein